MTSPRTARTTHPNQHAPEHTPIPALNVDNFPADLRRRLKAHAALQDMTVRESVIQAIQMWVAAHEDGGVVRLPKKGQ